MADYESSYSMTMQQAVNKVDQEATFFMIKVLRMLNLDPQVYQKTYELALEDPQTTQLVYAAQRGLLQTKQDAASSDLLTEQETLQAFEQVKVVLSRRLKDIKPAPVGIKLSDARQIIRAEVQRAQLADEIFAETEVEQEKFEASLRHFYKKAGEQQEAGNE